jgi:hypothetical protein
VSGIAPDLPIWAQWFAALAVPIAASVGLIIGVASYLLQRRKRDDDLWIRRYELILEFEKELSHDFLMSDGYTDHSPELTRARFIVKARFLFDDRVAERIAELSKDKRNGLLLWSDRELMALLRPFLAVRP